MALGGRFGGSMAHLHRLIFLFVFCFISAASMASVTVISKKTDAEAQRIGNDQQAACKSFNASFSCNLTISAAAANVSVGTCMAVSYDYYCVSVSSWGSWKVASTVSTSCPDNSVLEFPSVTLCKCNAGYVELAGACVTPYLADQAAKKKICTDLKGQTTYISAPGRLMPGQTVCGAAGCNLTVAPTVINFIDKTTGMGVGQGDATITETPCTYTAPTAGSPSSSDATVATPSTCKGGSVGSVNGIQTCIPYDPDKNTIQSVTSGSKTSSTTGATGGDSNSTTSTTSTTTCQGSNCTTSTTTTTTGGGSSSSPTSTTTASDVSKNKFCVDNPADPLCTGDKSTFSGVCGSPPDCKGDAVMCATANATFESSCVLNPKQNAESDLYDAEKGKTGNRNSEISEKDQVTISGSNFSSTNVFGSGACIPDRTYTIAGRPIEIPFSKVCDSLLMLGKLLVGISFLLAGRIVVRG